MKYKTNFLTLFAVVLLFGTTACTKHKTAAGDGSHMEHPSHNGTVSEKRGSTYLCPMHPQITSDKEGECPICGMNLVPAPAKVPSTEKQSSLSEPENSGSYPKGHVPIALSMERQQLIGVKTDKASTKNLFKTIRAPGRVAFDPDLYTAQIEYLQALKQRQRVRDSPLGSVKKNVENMVKSSQIRLRVLGLTQEQIRAITPNTKLSEELLISQKDTPTWIYADVFEMDLRKIRNGQTVHIAANYLEGTQLSGTVVSTDAIINPKTRTAKVRIKLNNNAVLLRPESYVDVNIKVPQGEHLTIPLNAILDTGEDTFVFVAKEGGTLEPRRVTMKFQAGDNVAIANGLSDGEMIVTSANFLIDSESRLKSVLETKMGTSSHQHH